MAPVEEARVWPEGRRAAVAFTFDLDGPELWTGDAGESPDDVLLSQGRFGVEVGVPALLDLLDRYDVHATFFVVGTVAESHPHVVSDILAGGHEVAAHGYTHRSPVDLDPEERATELERVRDVLTRAGVDLAGYRAPGWRLPPDGVAEIATHGYAYSSNYMDAVHPYRHPGTDLVELPVHWTLDDAPHLLFDPRDWTGAMRPNSVVREIWKDELRAIHEIGGLGVLTLHPQLIGRPGRLGLLEDMLNFVQRLPDVWVTPCVEIAQWVRDGRESASA